MGDVLAPNKVAVFTDRNAISAKISIEEMKQVLPGEKRYRFLCSFSIPLSFQQRCLLEIEEYPLQPVPEDAR